MIPRLLFDIAKCKDFLSLIGTPDTFNPCNEIVDFQRGKGTITSNDFQIPEPWNGDIINAPILIVSSNPSYSNTEMYPDLSWPEPIIADFFINRFKNRGPKMSWVFNHKIINKNGTRGKSVRYWTSIQKRVEELTGKIAIPGIDYCITEFVHCKSIKQIGVNKAIRQCSQLYFSGINNISGSCIIIAIGKFARNYFNNSPYYNGKPIIYLPAPNAYAPKKMSDHYTLQEIEKFRKIINNCKQVKKNVIYSDIKLPSDNEISEFFNNYNTTYNCK